MDFGKHYSVLSPFKCAFYQDRMKALTQDDNYNIQPVTAHLVPTLRCNHRCFFCTYGGIKDDNKRNGADGQTMPPSLIYKVLDQLALNDVRGVIFTGGGEPTVYTDLIPAMRYGMNKGMDIAINTNGHFSNEKMIRDLIGVNPKYIRISLNAGSNIVQKLTTGVDDFDLVLRNVEKLIEYKEKIKSRTDISIGYVVNVLNLHDLVKLSEILLKMEERIRTAHGIEQSIFSLQIRPVSNYENSKHIDPKALRTTGAYLRDHYDVSFEQEYYDFMLGGAQCSERTLKAALDTIENVLIPRFSLKSNIRIVYPRQKYIDLIGKGKRSYDRCLSCPWFLFIWPDGNVYHCVEWAGTPGFEIGNLNDSCLEDILMSQKRKAVLERINTSVIKERCAPVCAHHEMNLFLNGYINAEAGNLFDLSSMSKPGHLSFL